MCIPYILVKNSFGPSWGEDGYAKIMANNGLGVCGTNQIASYPVLVSIVTSSNVNPVEVTAPAKPLVDMTIKE
jgi:hypothetical protein